MHQVGLEGINGLGDRWSWQGQLELGVKRQRHRRDAHHLGAHVMAGSSFWAEHHHLIAGFH